MPFQYGAAVYPLAVGTNSTLLPVCDPALAKLLDFLRFVLTKYAGDAISSMLAVPTTDDASATIQGAVAMTAPIDPDTIARVEQLEFPLLAGWPKSTKYGERTLNWTQDTRTVGLAYVMRPLSAHQAILWSPLLNSISQICNACLMAGHDVDYRNDERVLLQNKITSARLLSADFGHYDFAGKQTPPYFPAWVAELEVIEKVQPLSTGLTDFAGADVVVTQQAEDDVSTFVAADASAGATTLRVASTAGWTALDVAIIGAGTAREETVSIVSIVDATHFTVSALTFAHTSAQADTVARKPVTIISAKTDVG